MSERLISDFTVRVWVDGDRGRVEVIGNRTGRSASRSTGVGIMWVFALLRALRDLGALGSPRSPAPSAPEGEG